MLFLIEILGFAAAIAAGYYIEKGKGGPESRNMEAGKFHKGFQKGFGVVCAIGMTMSAFSVEATLGTVALAFFAPFFVVYLLWPGYRSFIFFI